MTIVHIAGVDVTVGKHLRQRCSWCGATLIAYNNLDLIAVPEGQDTRPPATWPVGSLVEVDGHMSWLVPHEDGNPLPVLACARIDAEVTV